mgnify:CR=1 FL=1
MDEDYQPEDEPEGDEDWKPEDEPYELPDL